jgi:salicylate hydroxylase
MDDQNRETQPISIGVIGAGPAGVMTALSLEAYCPASAVTVTILDRNHSATDYPGVEYGIQARACRALERIGKLEEALEGANPATEVAFYNSRLSKRFSSVKFNPKYTRSVVRQDFLSTMTALLKHTSVKRRHLVEDVTFTPEKGVVVSGTTDDHRFSEHFDLVVGADGVNSVARKKLFPQDAQIYDRGFSCIYMLVEGTNETAPSGFMDIANSGRSELIMGHFSTMTLFPLGKGRLALGIGFDDATKLDLWKAHGLDAATPWKDVPAATKKSIAVRLTSDAKLYDGMLVKALDLVPDWDSYKIYLWAMRDTDPLRTPWRQDGNVILLGDSAHAIMPTIGMGASLAMEDAEALASLIARFVETQPSPAIFRAGAARAVLEPFTAARHPVWVDLIHRARRAAIGNFIDVGRRKRFAIGPQIPNSALSSLVMGAEWVAEKLGV